jgi:hypothetical protein
MGEACSINWGGEVHTGFWSENLRGNRRLDGPKHRWENDIKMDLLEVRCSMDRIDLAQDRHRWRAVLHVVMNLQIPWQIY